MKVEIHLYATLGRYLPDRVKEADGVIEIEEGITVGELMQRLKVPGEKVKLVFIDNLHADKDSVLQDGNRLGIFPPVGGG